MRRRSEGDAAYSALLRRVRVEFISNARRRVSARMEFNTAPGERLDTRAKVYSFPAIETSEDKCNVRTLRTSVDAKRLQAGFPPSIGLSNAVEISLVKRING